jgi:hypothetical protein
MNTDIIVGENTDGTERIERVKMLGRRIHVLRCKPRKDKLMPMVPDITALARVEDMVESSCFHEILSVSDKCRYFCPEHVGKAVKLGARMVADIPISDRVGPQELFVNEEAFERFDDFPLAVFDLEGKA